MARTSASSTTYTVQMPAVVARQPGTRYLASQPRRGWAQMVRTRARKAGATSSELLRRPATMITAAAPPRSTTKVRGTVGEEVDASVVIRRPCPSPPRPRQSRCPSSRHGGRWGQQWGDSRDVQVKGSVLRHGAVVVQVPVERDRGVDECQVCEGLREVANLLAGERDLLGVQPKVVGVGQHLLESHPSLADLSRVSQGADVGERT